mmetsp:Transcript_1884/g.4050  ORF Transcript_1884/g.4050 Transcript_1884/m.4050 type:complete len:569 (-) Transcript_1884:454-2160(-)
MHRFSLIALTGSSSPLPLTQTFHLFRNLNSILILQPHLRWFARTRMTSGQTAFALHGFIALLLRTFHGSLTESPTITHFFTVPSRRGIFHLLVVIASTTRTRILPLSLPSTLDHLRGVHPILLHPLLNRTGFQLGSVVVLVLSTSANLPRQGGTVPSTGTFFVRSRDLDAVADFTHCRLFHLVQAVVVVHPFQVGRLVFLLELIFLFFQKAELLVDIRIDVVGNVLPVEDLRNGIETPFGIGEIVLFAIIRCPDAGTTVLPHEFAGGLVPGPGGGGAVSSSADHLVVAFHGSFVSVVQIVVFGGSVSDARFGNDFLSSVLFAFSQDGLGDECLASDSVAGGGVDDLQTVHDGVHFVSGHARVYAGCQEFVAGSILHLGHPFLRYIGHLKHGRVGSGILHQFLDHGSFLAFQRVPGLLIDLVDHHDQLLIGKKRLNGSKQITLLLDGVPALLANVHEIQHRARQVSQRRNRLHLDRVPLLQRMIQNPRRVDHLPTKIFVIRMTHEQALGRKGIRLHVHAGPRDFVHERTLPHVGQPAHEQRPRVGVHCGQTRHVLPHFFQVGQTGLLAF